MQLSTLEIKGFKSFGDKVTIHFDAGVTGVVGPNGCGKSNVVDAIRWVLGEQKTKALRSEKMENIIFNGTKTRKALQMAEVSLTFNNTRNVLPTEYSQVTITRKYYRSGEGEYLLNHVPCRLKDITNLFLDTGIGSDSYAIIELKMVDDILNDKDNSRRGLFEEAAGISKFKIRKKETLRKLEDTDADLSRVEDLLHEINKNLSVLEKQARQAQQYFKLKEEYKYWSVALAQKTVSVHRETFIKLGKQMDAEQDRKLSLQTQLANQEAAMEREKVALVQKEQLLASRQKTLNELLNRIRHHESEKKIRAERRNLLIEKRASLQEQIAHDQQRIAQTRVQIERLQTDQQAVQQMLREAQSLVEALQQSYQLQQQASQALQRDANALHQTYHTLQQEVHALQQTHNVLQLQQTSLQQELEVLQSNQKDVQSHLQALQSDLNALQQDLAYVQSNLHTLQQQHKALQQQDKLLESDLEAMRQQVAEVSRKLDARQNEFNLTKSLVDSLEGFPEAMQFLKKHPAFDRHTPVLSDVLTCPAQYRVAIEHFLEPVMNYFVVTTEAEAHQAIALLDKAAKGRAHFFVLEYLNSYQPQMPALANEPAGIIAALQIVECEARYQPLAALLLDGVYVLTKPQPAIHSAENAIFITLDGKSIRRRFSLSGGSVGAFAGKRIGRAQNLTTLSCEITELTEQHQQLVQQQQTIGQQRTETLSEIARLAKRIEHQQRTMNQLTQQQALNQSKQEQRTQTLAGQENRRIVALGKMEKLRQQLFTQLPLTEKKETALKETEAQINRLNQELLTQNDISAGQTTAYNQANGQFHQQQNRLQTITQEIDFGQRTLTETQARTDKNQQEWQKTEAALAELATGTEISEDELQALYQEKSAVGTGVNEVERDYYRSRGEIDKIEKDNRTVQRQRETTEALLSELQQKRNETNLRLTAVQERLSVEFGIALHELTYENLTESGLHETALQDKVRETKQKLERIGPINPMALEAFEEIKQRYDFINEQKQDLVNAKESLLHTITQIDQVAKENFMQAYEQIRANFIHVFRSLFSEEDSCELKLSQPDNPLESAIDIVAKPKGKRPQTINQLSGGEKTLTAISLLFAIYLLKPAPFCIFDEVDAPLDDANIDKFNHIIRKFSTDSQFIIVTHNKRTMVATDIIYGITQTEDDIGVSKVVPVDLRALA